MIKVLAHLVLFAVISTAAIRPGLGGSDQMLRGTLVVAVPTREGLVACSDKRLYNIDSRKYTDSAVKIRKLSDRALFAATNTVAFYDRETGSNVFDIFRITSDHAAKHPFTDDRTFWNGLRKAIHTQLRAYFNGRPFAKWPESDRANNNLLFNLVFYSLGADKIYSHTIRVFYEKKKTPVILIQEPIREEVRLPKLSGKGTELLRWIARDRAASSDPLILRFGGAKFDMNSTSATEAVEFARRLFTISNTSLPAAQVSAVFDCAILDRSSGFRWLK